MAEIATVANDPASAQIEQYYNDVTDLAQQALDGEIGEDEYRKRMNEITAAAILLLFLLGGGVLNDDGSRIIAQQTAQAQSSIATLSDDIFSGKYSANETASPGRPIRTKEEGADMLYGRFVIWTYTLSTVFEDGQLFKSGNYMWKAGPTEHCVVCQALDGVVLSAEEWKQSGHKPNGPTLECTGYGSHPSYCQCTFVPSAAPSIGLENLRV